MGERGVRNAEVEGSNPLPSTTLRINRYPGPTVTGCARVACECTDRRSGSGRVPPTPCLGLTQGYVAEVMESDRIPAEFRYFGNEFPFLGKAVLLAKDDITIPPWETGNKRCA